MKYIAKGFDGPWLDEPVVTVTIHRSEREEWSLLNPDFWWSFQPVPSMWDRLTRAARSRTFGHWLGRIIVLVGLLAALGLAGAVEGGWR